jgi:hypothetical protein
VTLEAPAPSLTGSPRPRAAARAMDAPGDVLPRAASPGGPLCLCGDPGAIHDLGGVRWQPCGRPGCGCASYRTDSRLAVPGWPDDAEGAA